MLWLALLLGVVEGLTEFLPISSTGHLIVVSAALDFHGRRAEVFQIFIQLGAILAVVWEYRWRFAGVAVGLGRDPRSRRFALNLAIAFVPAAAVGLLVHDWISAHLFQPMTVAAALAAGGVGILVVESLPRTVTAESTDAVTPRQALLVGVAQCLSLWPGFSRAAATILGGLMVGMDRKTATEFSFFLAVPIMVAATGYDLAKNYGALEAGDGLWLGVSFVTAFVVAWASIRWLIRFVSTHSFRPFAWYRLVLAAVVALYFRG